MQSLWKTQDYRVFLRALASEPTTKRGFQANLARAMGCQAAYLSQVLKGSSELTEDHAIRAAQFLELAPDATEYFVLLVRLSRASTPELREYLNSRKQTLLRESSEIQSRIKTGNSKLDPEVLTEYFSSGAFASVHLATSSENYQTLEALADRFQMSQEKVQEILNFLNTNGFVERDGVLWKYAGAPLHFPRRSPIDVVHQSNRRLQAIRSIENHEKTDLHFSSIFTLDLETYGEIKQALLDYIEKSHKKIHAGGTTEVYSMCLDLFKTV